MNHGLVNEYVNSQFLVQPPLICDHIFIYDVVRT